MRECPDADTLAKLLEDQLATNLLIPVEEHVERCEKCQMHLENSTREGSGQAVRAYRASKRESAAVNADLIQRLSESTKIFGQFSNYDSAPRIESQDLSPRVEGYEILGEIDRGGMAIVYKARHLRLNRLVALKMVTSVSPRATGFRERLRMEARALAQLRHPNIVQVFDFGEQNGMPYFSLELVEGTNLARWLAGTPRVPRIAAQIVETLARAVEYAHQHGVLHRDLKPANVLVAESVPSAEDGSVPPLKVSDFGLSKAIDGGTVAEQFSEAGALLGTPSYMAPEQARSGDQPVGCTADVYSLGAILYEILSGRPPFLASTPLQTLLQVVHDDPVPIRRLQQQMPRDLATICDKCLEKDPARRYSSAALLADDLTRFLNHEPVLARPLGPAGRLRHWVRRRPTAASFIAALIAVVVLGFSLVLWQWQEASQARHRAETLATSEADARRQAERTAAELILDQSLELCEQGEVGAGMTGLANGLRRAVQSGLSDLEPAFRANLACWSSRLQASSQSPPQGASITSVAFSPDGKRLLVGRWANKFEVPGPGEAQLYDPAGWIPIGPPLQHNGPVTAVAFSPDGTRLLTAGRDGSVGLWDAATGKAVRPMHIHLQAVFAVAFSSDGKTYAAGGVARNSESAGEVHLWKTETGEEAIEPLSTAGPVQSLAFSPDGSALLTGSNEPAAEQPQPRGEAILWNLESGQPIGPVMHHAAPIRTVGFNPNGKFLLTGSDDQTTRLWERDTGRPAGRALTHPYPILSATFSPDGKTIIVAGGNSRVRGGEGAVGFWDTLTGKPLVSPLNHPDIVHGVAVRPDGRAIATACRDGRIRLWELANARAAIERIAPFTPSAIRFSSSNNHWVLVGGDDPITHRSCSLVWDVSTDRRVGVVKIYPALMEALAFAPDGQSYAFADKAKQLHFIDAATGKSLAAALEVPQKIESLAFHADGKSLLISTKERLARWVRLPDGAILRDFTSDKKGVNAAIFSPDGRSILTGGADGYVQIHRTDGEPDSPPIAASPQQIRALAFHSTGRTIIVGTEEGTARAYDAATGEPVGPPLIHDEQVVWTAGYTGDGEQIYTIAGSGYRDWGTLRFWDAARGSLLARAVHFRAVVKATDYHRCSMLLATAGWDGDIRLWDARSGKAVGPGLRCAYTVSGVSFSPDGQSLAACCDLDRTLRIWNIPKPVEGTPDEIDRWVQLLMEGNQVAIGDGAIPAAQTK